VWVRYLHEALGSLTREYGQDTVADEGHWNTLIRRVEGRLRADFTMDSMQARPVMDPQAVSSVRNLLSGNYSSIRALGRMGCGSVLTDAGTDDA